MSATLGLGTVQFGGAYGVSNTKGIPTVDQVANIIAEARKMGVEVLDTAALYGTSEDVLGMQDLSGFKVVTKTPRFAVSRILQVHCDELLDTFQRSLNRLNLDSVYALLSHHADDLLAPGGELLWESMLEIKQRGEAQRIGVSIYDGSQLDNLMQKYSFDIVQVPINVFDQRLIQGGQIERLRAAGVEIHVRSVFLQGLLLMDDYPSYFEPVLPDLNRLKSAIREEGLTPAQAALAFVRDLPGVDVVLVGVADVAQLRECVGDFNADCSFDGQGFSCNIVDFVDPTRWDIK
ncbi:aldo/keto reductase [Desulfuromonas acetoxidans]|uniref:aldo/keto reductase n=1 Tax=Desulfuromonas acetoxidans TaxID=891 RepID=UPI00292DA6C7|nr:aldo/keto reductase [Desulfuromonas acetoxidans]